MSVRLMTAVWDLDLPPGEKLVLLALADQANDEGHQCWPAVSTIARKSGQGERTVRRALADLEAKGHLTRGHRDGASTQYHVHPGQSGTPAKLAPLPKTTGTPAKLAPKTPVTIIPHKRRARAVKAEPFRLPDDWKPIRFADDTVARAVIDRRGIDWARAALERFRNWAANAEDKPGKGRKHDWQKAWGNWVIEQDSKDGSRSAQRPASQSGHGSTVDAAQRFLARHQAASGQPS